MLSDLLRYDHEILAALALGGTFAASGGVYWLTQRSGLARFFRSLAGVSPPFAGVIGVLFALNLAFLANDTWIAHDRAREAVFQEGGSLREIARLAQGLDPAIGSGLAAAARDYADLTVAAEWPLLARRSNSPAASEALQRLLGLLSSDPVARGVNANVHALLLSLATQVRAARTLRLALSQTHVNPLKWLGVAFLGMLTLATVAMVHIEQPRAQMVALMLFAASAAPTSAIVLMQGNPFQTPVAVSPDPIAGAIEAPPTPPTVHHDGN